MEEIDQRTLIDECSLKLAKSETKSNGQKCERKSKEKTCDVGNQTDERTLVDERSLKLSKSESRWAKLRENRQRESMGKDLAERANRSVWTPG